MSKLSLPFLVSLVFTLILFMGTLFMGLTTGITMNEISWSTVDSLETIMIDSELDVVEQRLSLLSSQASSLFGQGAATVRFGVQYAEESLNASIKNGSLVREPDYNMIQDAVDVLGIASDDNNLVLSNAAAFYDSDSSLKWQKKSSLLHNVIMPIYLANPENYENVYVGFEDGFFRSAPFGPSISALGFETKKFGCVNSFGTFDGKERENGRDCTAMECAEDDSTDDEDADRCRTCDGLPFKSGYDPRCREWYDSSRLLWEGGEMEKVFMSKPYIDATTGNTVVSIAKGFQANDTLAGVFSLDMASTSLRDAIVGATVLNKGYAFLMSEDGYLIASKRLTNSQVSQLVTVFEKDYGCDAETTVDLVATGCTGSRKQSAEKFRRLLKSGISSGNTETDMIDGQYISLRQVSGTEYIIGMSVPKDDVEAASEDLTKAAERLDLIAIITCCVIGVSIMAVGIFYAR